MPRLLTRPVPPRDQPFRLNRDSIQARGLVAWYPATASRGTAVLRDLTGRAPTAALSGTYAWTADPLGLFGPSLDGSSGVATVAAGSSLDNLPSGDFSIAAWVRRTAAGANHMIASKQDGAVTGWWLRMRSDDFVDLVVGRAGGTLQVISSSTYGAGLYHVVATAPIASGGNPRVYVNGVEVAYSTQATGSGSAPDDSALALAIGAHTGAFWNFAGPILDLRFYRRDLTPTDVGQLYAAQTRWELYQPSKLRVLVQGAAAPATLSSVAVNDGLALVAGGGAHRVNFVGANTTWLSGTPSISPSSGSLGAITVDTNTTAHANYTPPGSSGTITFTDTTDGNSTATLAVLAAATGYSLSGPSSGTTGSPSTSFTVALTPSGSAVETAVVVTPAISPDGSVSGTVTLVARTADASGTFTVTPAADGAHTVSTSDNGGLTDPSSLSYTASSYSPGEVADPAVFFSPYTWRKSGNSYAVSNNHGAYVKFQWTGTSLAIGVDPAALIAASTPSPGQYPSIKWSIDDGDWTSHQFASSETSFTLATGLANTTHTLFLYIYALNYGPDRWTTPVAALKITKFTTSAGAALAATAAHPYLMTDCAVVYGDSITEMVDPRDDYVGIATEALNCEYGQIGWSGQGWHTAPGGISNGEFHVAGGSRTWDLYSAGQTRLVAGLFSPAPKYIVVMHGTNDSGASDGQVQADVTSWIAAARTAAPSARIVVVIPPGGGKRSAITAGVAAAADATTTLVDLGAEFQAGFSGTSRRSADGTHPNAQTHGYLGARLAQKIQAALASGGGPTPQIGSPFVRGAA